MFCRSALLALFLAFAVPALVPSTSPMVSIAHAQTAAPDAQAQELLKKADQLYHFNRSEPGMPAQIKGHLDQAQKLIGDKYEVCWQQARILWWMADGEADSSKMAEIAKKGWEWGEKAHKLNPNGVESNFWTAANIGQYSLAIGVLRAIANGLEGKFNGYLDKSVAINKRYECGGPLRTKGSYYQNLPWPKRDLPKSIQLLKEAYQLEPCGVRGLYNLAEALEKNGDRKASIAELDRLLAAKPSANDPGDLPRMQQRAKTFKAQLQAK